MKFSIVIPSFNRPKSLLNTLESLLQIKYDNKSFEVIIIENGFSDNQTRKMVGFFQSRYKNISYFHIWKKGASNARNFGAKKARFSHLIFIDDDIQVPPLYLKGYESAWLKYPKAKVIGGKIIAQVLPQWKLSTKEIDFLKNYGWCFAHLDYGPSDYQLKSGFVYSANISVKKDFENEVFFNTLLGTPLYYDIQMGAEDVEICWRLLLFNKQIIYCADERIEVKHYIGKNRFSSKYLLKRHILTGIEMWLVENYLASNYRNFKPSFLKHYFGNVNSIYKTLTDKYRFVAALSYLLNKNLFISS